MAQAKNHFQLVRLRGSFIVGSIVLLTVLAAYAPDSTPWYLLGPLGRFAQYMINNHAVLVQWGPMITLGLHGFETFIAYFVTRSKNISGSARLKWMVQTLLFGFASLGLLINYTPGNKVN